MSVFTERGASSSSMNLMNSSTRFPDGAGIQNPYTGSVLSAGFSAACRRSVRASSRQSHFLTVLMVDASSRSETQFFRRLPGWLVRVFRLDDFAHKLRREPGVLVREFDSDSFTIHHRQLMAQLVTGVTVVANLVHSPREVAVVLICFAGDDAVVAVHSGDATVGVAVELSAEVRHDLPGADRLCGSPHPGRALVH